MAGLTNLEVMRIVNPYIGVSGGYLGDFSCRTHADFYADYCDLDVNPNEMDGTTRERFISILQSANALDQAKIIRGVVERFPLGQFKCPKTRTEELRDELLEFARRLEGEVVDAPHPQVTSAVVHRAITDAEMPIRTQGATSGVDRVHTALHGYLIAVQAVRHCVCAKCHRDSIVSAPARTSSKTSGQRAARPERHPGHAGARV